MKFNLQYVITEQCNLKCSYCYMNQHSTTMNIDVFHRAYNFINSQLKSYMNNSWENQITFFGGEPLLNLNLINEVSPLYSNIPKKIITNGLLLTPEIYSKLENFGIDLSISFDGFSQEWRSLHNNYSSLSLYKDFHLSYLKKIKPKVMLHPDSIHQFIDNIKYFWKNQIFSPDFTIVRDNVWTEKNINEFKYQLNLLKELYLTIDEKEDFPIPGFLILYIGDIIYGRSYGKRPFGCFTGINGVSIMPDGNIYPCARFGTNKKFPYANCLTNTINRKNIDFIRQIHNPCLYDECQECKLYQFCNVGCYYVQLEEGTWTHMKPASSVCKLLKMLYKESLEFYQILKHNQWYRQKIENLLNS